ncbi:MAG: heme o synthase [Planctomycetota bacterium]
MTEPHPLRWPKTSSMTAAASAAGSLGALIELTKPRLSLLVVLTTGLGYGMACGASWSVVELAATLVGTALAAGSANALNQWSEARSDARMERTRYRPLPAGRLDARTALLFATAAGIAGVTLLACAVTPLAALLALAAIAIYVGLYTPLKKVTTLNTLFGAVAGALPPLIGWTAGAEQGLEGAWVLFAILFVWQIPHFMAVAWIYREDYLQGGFRMLPVVDPSGRMTAQVVLLFLLALVPVSLSAAAVGLAGPVYLAGTLVVGLLFLACGWRFHRERSDATARRLFVASLVYLPAVMTLMVLDRLPRGAVEVAERAVTSGG